MCVRQKFEDAQVNPSMCCQQDNRCVNKCCREAFVRSKVDLDLSTDSDLDSPPDWLRINNPA